MLEIRDLVVGYGDVGVLWECSLHIERGEVVTSLGVNGAGKTTLMRAISCIVRKHVEDDTARRRRHCESSVA